MRHFLSNEDILPLYLVEGHAGTEFINLPSWVIDWSACPVPRAGLAFDGKGARRAYRSCGLPGDQKQLFRLSMKPSDNGDRIFCEGIHLDIISEIV